METNRQDFLKKFNEAFATSDVDFILTAVSDDILWTIAGDKVIQGKDQFASSLHEMASPEPMKLKIRHLITHGKEAAVEGTMTTPNGKTYSFCDIYTFNGFKDAQIKEMKSYVVEEH
ncbi:nuclear transport factor 2 family protein [Cyclobacterium jeungdonense]|uniref:Nuclear transport factor 2 family protein n=1 Tax=Cyclobacterium jeungdonense TaxID=708087 RepID=A0ABT8C6H0_9BACT|nr:nuclear transport factor 2 family protein [Cyclobacterium jeungdonense]MDN3687657.1 nuclear transport factor 2 family protein [Cyclobacterium jeungdonense]